MPEGTPSTVFFALQEIPSYKAKKIICPSERKAELSSEMDYSKTVAERLGEAVFLLYKSVRGHNIKNYESSFFSVEIIGNYITLSSARNLLADFSIVCKLAVKHISLL